MGGVWKVLLDPAGVWVSYRGRQVTTSVPAVPGQATNNVEHLELELWRRGRAEGVSSELHMSDPNPLVRSIAGLDQITAAGLNP